MRLFAVTLTVLAAIICFDTAKADEASKRSPGSQVLDHFVGTWDMKVTVKPAGGEATTFDAVSFRRWSQGGSFVAFEETGPEEVNLPITYDPESKTYPGVMMIGVSRGVVTGTWDEDKKTMHFVIENDNKTTYRGTHRFVRKDYAEASGSITDADGKVVLELSWKQTRRKDTPKATDAKAEEIVAKHLKAIGGDKALKNQSQYKTLAYKGQENVKGKEYHVLEGVYEDGAEESIYLDVKTHLIRLVRMGSGARAITVELSDYREVDGVQLAFSAIVSLGTAEAFLTFKVDKITHGVKVDDAIFAMPTN